MKQVLCTLLALCTLLGFAACGEPEESKESSTVSMEEQIQETPYYLDTLSDNVYGEEIFRVMTIKGNIPDEEKSQKNIVSEKLYTRDVRLEDRYGISMAYKEIKNDSSAITDMQNAATNSDVKFHAFVTNAERLMNLAASGYVENLNDVQNLDMEKEWWSQSLNQNCTINNTLYCSAGPYSEYYYHAAICLAYNKSIASKYDGMDIYNDVLDGSWTLEQMKRYCVDFEVTNDDNGDSFFDENDTYAISANSSVMYGMFAGAGGRFSTMDEEGNIEIPLASEQSQRILERILTVFRSDNVYLNKYQESAKQFTKGKALFLYTSTGYLYDYLPSSKVDYGIIPLPKYDSNQTQYITCAWPTSNYCTSIPIGLSEDEKGFAGLMLEAYCFLSYELVRPAKYETVLKLQIALDPTASELMDIIFNNMYFDMNLVFDFGGSRSAVQNVVKSFSMGRYTAVLEGIRGEINGDIEKLLAPTRQ